MSIPWFQNARFPLYLAPMAGVTDLVFRTICKELGADVMITEFVSSEGIIRKDERTRKYTEFTEEQRPVGVQLFGADGERMGEAAKKIISWKQPDFIDLNFGCPVNKVVAKNGGASLLKDCPSLAMVAAGVVNAVGDQIPVTAKIRIGWDERNINAPDVCHLLEDSGMQAISIHGRTRSQGYGGDANWEVIDRCARSVTIPDRDARAAATAPTRPATAKACISIWSVAPERFPSAINTPGRTPAPPAVGAATITPMAALTSWMARAPASTPAIASPP